MVQSQTAVFGSDSLNGFPSHIVGLVWFVDAAAEAAASALVAYVTARARSTRAALPALPLLAGLVVVVTGFGVSAWIGERQGGRDLIC
ncbi:hypothetical protein F2Q70_00005150 [Brassica cretica]|uniref:Uncharacterized protein n=1 Tax=Brassica cretica TaxID=69181 RepID=A0A8S9IWY4_BRACR|nr:hypothetical protein F2Q70_00005150 [Brassica cretica]